MRLDKEAEIGYGQIQPAGFQTALAKSVYVESAPVFLRFVRTLSKQPVNNCHF